MTLEEQLEMLRKAALALVGVEDDIATLQVMHDTLRSINDTDADLCADVVSALIATRQE